MKFTPLQDRILIRRIDEKNETSGGIIIPDSAKEKAQEGEVVAVGKGKRDENGTVQPIDVKKGDRILFGKYTGSDFKLDGVEHLILREDEVLGVLEGQSK
jgi:chaperonin GroES